MNCCNCDTGLRTYRFHNDVVISDKDKSQKITNFAYVRLMNLKDGTTLLDGHHDLVMYKVRCIIDELKTTNYREKSILKHNLYMFS